MTGHGPGPLTVTADRAVCVSSGNCVTTAPEVFDQGQDDGVVILLEKNPAEGSRERVELAAELCPVRAIGIKRGDGR